MAPPTVTCEIAFATDPAVTPVWTDVTSYLQSFSYQRGRQTERDVMQAGTATLVLNNLDRRFDPTYTSSPYYPNVVPMRRVRISAGYAYYGRVLAANPVGYWRFNETSGTVAADSTINANNGTYTNTPTLNQTSPLTGDSTSKAVAFAGGAGPSGQYVDFGNPAAFQVSTGTLECWVKTTTPGTGYRRILVKDSAFGLMLFDGVLVLFDWGAGLQRATTKDLRDGVWHHIAVTFQSGVTNGTVVYLDGVAVLTTTITVSSQGSALRAGGADGSTQLFAGTIDEPAIYGTVLTARQIADHAAASSEGGPVFGRLFSGYADGWTPVYPGPVDSDLPLSCTDGFKVFALKALNTTYGLQASGTRIVAVLNTIGWPAADRSLNSGNSSIQAVTLVDTAALQHLQDVVSSENGAFFINGAGNAVFLQRQYRYFSPYSVSQGTFGDGGGSELPYVDVTLDYGDSQLWNEVRVTRAGGTVQTASDSASQTKYYPRTLSKTGLLVTTDNEAFDAANWLLQQYKNPGLRIASIALDGEGAPSTLWPQLLGRELGDRITVRRRPPGGGSMIEQQSFIEAMQVSWTAAGGFFEHHWTLSPADLANYWILGDSTYGLLGSTTKLGY